MGELTRIYGVGPWTAELAVALVHPLFPVGPKRDLAVKRGWRGSSASGWTRGGGSASRGCSETTWAS